MQLTGKQIAEKKIIGNFCEEGIQQQGIDVRLDTVSMTYMMGCVPAKGKTIACKTKPVEVITDSDGSEIYVLEPGYYEVTLMENCEMPNNMVLNFKTRSSLVRCGVICYSGQFDAGFKTDKMGCFMHVIQEVQIERGARIAQAVVNETYTVDDCDLYNGQWQNDKQRIV